MTPRLAPLPVERIGEMRTLVGAAGRASELLDRLTPDGREVLALGAYDENELAGVALYGEVAGARGAAALHWLAVRPDARRTGVARLLVERVVTELRATGARLVVAELPGAAVFTGVLGLLAACDFRHEGSISDFYRDGVPLLILGRRLE